MYRVLIVLFILSLSSITFATRPILLPSFDFHLNDESKVYAIGKISIQNIVAEDCLNIFRIGYKSDSTYKLIFSQSINFQESDSSWRSIEYSCQIPLESGLVNQTNSLVFSLADGRDSTFTTCDFYFLHNEHGLLLSDIFSITRLNGYDFKIYKNYYDYAHDTLCVRVFSKLNGSVHTSMIFNISGSFNDFDIVNRLIKVDVDEMMSGYAYTTFPISNNAVINGGKIDLNIDVYNELRIMLFSLNGIPLWIRGDIQEKSKYIKYNDYFDSITLETLDTLSQCSMLIASKDEYQLYQKLNLFSDKIKFLREFWRVRTNSEEKWLPDLQTILMRIKICQQSHFEYLGTPFWQTDRGRILITYGEPNEIEREPFGRNNVSVEVWNYYNLDGKIFFIFIDETRSNKYRLIHSNKSGEIYDPFYQNKNFN